MIVLAVYKVASSQSEPTLDNLTPQEIDDSSNHDGHDGRGVSCPGSSGVADADDESRKLWIVVSFTDMMGCSIVTVPSSLMS